MKSVLAILLFLPFAAFAQSDFEKGKKSFAGKEFVQAKTHFENHLKQNPKYEPAILYLADTNSHLLQWEAAVSGYLKLKTLHPTSADYQYKYGGALAMVAQGSNKLYAVTLVNDIESAFLKAIGNDPKHIEARWALVELYLQLPVIVGGSEKKAAQYANQLQSLSTVDGYLAKGRIAEYFDRFTTAEQLYRKAVEIGNSKTSNQKLADLYQNKMHQPEKAKAVWAQYNKTKG